MTINWTIEDIKAMRPDCDEKGVRAVFDKVLNAMYGIRKLTLEQGQPQRRRVAEVKLKRNTADERTLKWNVMYLVPPEDTDVIEKMCVRSACLVLPPSDDLWGAIEMALENGVTKFDYIGPSRSSEASLSFDKKPEWLNDSCTIVVPVLGGWNKTLNMMSPMYLAGEKHKNCIDRETKYGKRHTAEDFPEDAYIQTPAGRLQPICLACTNSLKGMLGECQLGSGSCLDSLVFNGIPSFKNRYDQGAIEDIEDFRELNEMEEHGDEPNWKPIPMDASGGDLTKAMNDVRQQIASSMRISTADF